MAEMYDLSHVEEVIAKLNSRDYSLEGEINLACWLGERAHLLVAEIKRLREAATPDDRAEALRRSLAAALAERDALRAAEAEVKQALVETFAAAISGLADAAVIRQQVFTFEHVAGAVRQLGEYSKGLEGQRDALRAALRDIAEDRIPWRTLDDMKRRAAEALAAMPPQAPSALHVACAGLVRVVELLFAAYHAAPGETLAELRRAVEGVKAALAGHTPAATLTDLAAAHAALRDIEFVADLAMKSPPGPDGVAVLRAALEEVAELARMGRGGGDG